MRQSPSNALNKSATDADSALPKESCTHNYLVKTKTQGPESGAHAPDWDTHETTLIKWRIPPSSTHTVPATSWSSDCGRGGKESQGPIQHGPILSLPAASHYLMKRPRSLPGTKPQRREDTVCTIIHTRWTNAKRVPR